jgi:hypothetical protein
LPKIFAWECRRPLQRKKVPDELDFRRAAKTLLELYAHLQAEQARERDEDLGVRLPTVRLTKQ